MSRTSTQTKDKWRFTLGNVCSILVGLYIATVFVFNYDVDKNYISQIVFILLAAGCALYCLIQKRNFSKSYIYLWIILVVGLSFLSVAWAVDPSFSMSKSITVLQLGFLALFVFLIVDDRYKLDLVLKCIILAGYFMYAYSVFSYGIAGIQEMASDEIRIGGAVNQENAFGLYSAMVFMLALYEVIYCHRKKYLLLIPVPVILALLTGSKKSALLLIVLFVVMVLMQEKRHFVLRVLGVGIVLAVAAVLLYNMGILDTLIKRTELMQSGTDDSTIERMAFIEFGWKKIKQKPFLGYGVEQFAILYRNATGIEIPSHNNYIQIAVSFGIVGFILWYSAYALFLKVGIKYFYYDRLAPLLFFFVVMTLINDITTTTLINKMTYITIAICFSAVNIIYKDNQTSPKRTRKTI